MSEVQGLEQLKCEIGHPAPTVRDIARLARVSTATVSRVLNGGSNVSLQRERSVKDAIKRTGFKPNAAAARMAGLAALKRRGKQEA